MHLKISSMSGIEVLNLYFTVITATRETVLVELGEFFSPSVLSISFRVFKIECCVLINALGDDYQNQAC